MSFLLDIFKAMSGGLPKRPTIAMIMQQFHKAYDIISGNSVRTTDTLALATTRRQSGLVVHQAEERMAMYLTRTQVKRALLSGAFTQQWQRRNTPFLFQCRYYSDYRGLSTALDKVNHTSRYVGSAYEVSFRCHQEERQKFHVSRCLVPISVGQRVHEGDKLKDTLGAINATFSSCVLMIDDSIQAATHMLSEDMRNIHGEEQWQSISHNVIRAILEGDQWLLRNRQLIKSQITIPLQIVRWYEWRTDPDFQKAIRETRMLYRENELFRNAIDHNTSEFLARYEKNHHVTEGYLRERAEWFCKEYLLEECAVMMHLWPKLACEYEVYPSGRNTAMQAAFDLYIKSRFPNLLKSVALRFRRIQSNLENSNSNTNEGDSESEETHEIKTVVKPRH